MFCTIFSITVFFNRTYTIFDKISVKSFFKVVFYSFIENIGFRQLVNYYRLSVFFTYHKNKNAWGKIERKKI